MSKLADHSLWPLMVLRSFPDDVDAFNRLGRAYMETGALEEAKQAYEQSLNLDRYNSIAKKNLQRLSQLDKTTLGSKVHEHVVEPRFIEEAGKSGVVSLQRLAAPAVLVRLVAGDKVYLKVDDTNLNVKTITGEYIGRVEPRHAQRLIRLMNSGNKYSAAIISGKEDRVTIIIRETYQDPSMVGQPSFPPRWAEALRPYSGDKAVETRWEEEEELEEAGCSVDDEQEDFENTKDNESED